MALNLQKINKYLDENKDRVFKWGEFDCCTFACDIVMLAGGEDFAKDVRGTYDTEVGAKRVLSKHFGSVEDAFSPLTEIPFNFAQRGDLALFDTDQGKVMSLVWANGYLAIGHKGKLGVMLDIDKPLKAWRIN